jgi:hypothetical protein
MFTYQTEHVGTNKLKMVIVYTGRFIMFSKITDTYNKKNQMTYLNGIVQSEENWKKKEQIFLQFPLISSDYARKLVRTPSTSSSAVKRRPLDFCSHRHSVSVNCLYDARIVLSVVGFFAYFARNARCTVTTDLLVWYSNTQNDFCPWSGHFLTTYTRIA